MAIPVTLPTGILQPGGIYNRWICLGRTNGQGEHSFITRRRFRGMFLEDGENFWYGPRDLSGGANNAYYIVPPDSSVLRDNLPVLPDGYTIIGRGVPDSAIIPFAIMWSPDCPDRWSIEYRELAGASPRVIYAQRTNTMNHPVTQEAPPISAPLAVRQWEITIGADPINSDELISEILPHLEIVGNAPALAAALDAAIRCSDPEIMIESWIDKEPVFISQIEFVPLAEANGIDISAIAESSATISDVITKAAAGVMLRGGFSDHFRYREDGTLVIDPSSPPTVDQAYELLKRTLEVKETASKLDNYSAWMLGMIADQFEGYFGEHFDPSIIMAQTSRAYNTYICSLKTFRSWWSERRQLSFTHHREVEYAKHIDHDGASVVLDMSEKFGLTVMQQRKLISYAKRFPIAQLEGELEEAGVEGVDDLMERIDIRAVNKRYIFYLRSAQRWYEYKGPFEHIPNGASPIINADTREVMAQDGQGTKPEEWVPPITQPVAPMVEIPVEADEEDDEDAE